MEATAKTIKVTVNFKDKGQGVEVQEGTMLSDVLNSVRDEMGIPDVVITKIKEIALGPDYVVKDGEEVFVSAAEITYGPNTVDASSFVGMKLGDALKEFGQALNIPTDDGKMEAEVDGKTKNLRYKIQPGDRIIIEKKKGKKL